MNDSLRAPTLATLLVLAISTPVGPAAFAEDLRPVVVITTSLGVIKLELDADKAPKTVANFFAYADAGYYDGTIFHRVIPGFMIQGGGLTSDMTKKSTQPPVVNEAKNGLKNVRGSVAMARTSNQDSATSQFFVNLKDNKPLDHGVRDYGYAVFGRVTDGMDVVDKIAAVPTARQGQRRAVPKEPVLIESVKREKPKP